MKDSYDTMIYLFYVKYFKDTVMVCYIYPQSLTRSRDIQVGGTALV